MLDGALRRGNVATQGPVWRVAGRSVWQRTILADPFMPRAACGSQRKRSVPARLSATFHVCVPVYVSGVVFLL